MRTASSIAFAEIEFDRRCFLLFSCLTGETSVESHAASAQTGHMMQKSRLLFSCLTGEKVERESKLRSTRPMRAGRKIRRREPKNFSARGHADGAPRPEIFFSLSLKDNFDPPSWSGWKTSVSSARVFPLLFSGLTGETSDETRAVSARTKHLIQKCRLLFSCLTGEKVERESKLRSTRPMRAGRKNRRREPKNFSGRGHADGAPRPEIFFTLSLKDNFDPPSRSGWKTSVGSARVFPPLFSCLTGEKVEREPNLSRDCIASAVSENNRGIAGKEQVPIRALLGLIFSPGAAELLAFLPVFSDEKFSRRAQPEAALSRTSCRAASSTRAMAARR
jgi:hypothetical protein